jgi:hypothetical protein
MDGNDIVRGYSDGAKESDEERKIDWSITCIEQKICRFDAPDPYVDIFVFVELKTPMDEENGFNYERRSMRAFLETDTGSRFKGEGWKYELLDTFAVDAEGMRK